MAGFKFRLESLLKLRIAERDRRRAEVAEVQQAIDIMLQQIAEMEAEAEQMTEARRRAGQAGPLSVDALVNQDRFRAILKLQVASGHEQKAKLDAEAERRRLVLQTADHEVRILEKLKEKQQAEFDFAEGKRIQTELDEIAGRRRGFGGMETGSRERQRGRAEA